MFARLFTLALAATSVLAIITPTSPDSNTVVKVGQDINALWTADTTGTWTNVQIQLMTGDNLQMVALATLATGIDGTKTTSFTYPAPDVSPYSKIYFLQFTLGGDVSTATWTTRFTIAGADGSVTDPTNSTVYSGTAVQWGTGTLLGAVSNTTDATSGSASSPVSASGSSIASAVSESASSAVASATSTTSSGSAASASAASTTSSRASSSVSAAAAAASSKGAAVQKSTVGLGAIVLALAGFIAL